MSTTSIKFPSHHLNPKKFVGALHFVQHFQKLFYFSRLNLTNDSANKAHAIDFLCSFATSISQLAHSETPISSLMQPRYTPLLFSPLCGPIDSNNTSNISNNNAKKKGKKRTMQNIASCCKNSNLLSSGFIVTQKDILLL